MIREVREELAAVISAAVTGWTVTDHVPTTPHLPAIWVNWPSLIDFGQQTLSGQRKVSISVTGCVGTGDAQAAQHTIDELTGKTIPDAVAGHASTVWLHATPTTITNIRVDEDRLLADLNFDIYA
jgi:hypothetical protein